MEVKLADAYRVVAVIIQQLHHRGYAFRQPLAAVVILLVRVRIATRDPCVACRHADWRRAVMARQCRAFTTQPVQCRHVDKGVLTMHVFPGLVVSANEQHVWLLHSSTLSPSPVLHVASCALCQAAS